MKCRNQLKLLVMLARLERATYCLEGLIPSLMISECSSNPLNPVIASYFQFVEKCVGQIWDKIQKTASELELLNSTSLSLFRTTDSIIFFHQPPPVGAGKFMFKTESLAEFLARGGVVKKVSAKNAEEKSTGWRCLGNTKKSEWNRLKAWKLKKGVGQ